MQRVKAHVALALHSAQIMWGALRHTSPLKFRVIVGGSLLLSTGLGSHEAHCMPPRRVPRQDQSLPDARTRFTLVNGNPNAKVEDRFEIPQDSPMVTSWPFMDWRLDAGPPAVASAPRSRVVGALLHATRRPTLLEQSALEEYPFLSAEVEVDEASRWATSLDSTDAFKSIYKRFGDWMSQANSFSPSAANPDDLLLREDSFDLIETWTPAKGPPELAYLARTSIADLIYADDDLSDEAFVPRCLARAYLLMGSKDNQTERDDEASTVRLASEQIVGILKKELRNDSPSSAGLAQKFVTLLHDVQLPATFCMQAILPKLVLREFELGYTYAQATALAASAIEAELFLNIGGQFPVFSQLLHHFPTGPAACAEFTRLTAMLLPSSLSTSSNLVKLPALAELFGRASWQQTLTHLINANPSISGADLVSTLISTHTEVAGSSSGNGTVVDASSSSTADDSGAASYGSIREQSVGDALRLVAAVDALTDAATQSGVERVETLMLSGSVLLTRAVFLQEAWLHNKHPTIAFCSLDRPYLCPYFAEVLTEEVKTGTIPARLESFVFPPSQLAVLRTKTWSALNIIGMALDIRRLTFGTTYEPVKASEVYVVESSLRAVREIGSRLFYALNLSLSPTSGYSFTDGIDLQLKAVDFATSLPKKECVEWLKYLSTQFTTHWLDGGGEHYHSKIKTGRPDAPEAQLDEFLPLANPYHINVEARMARAAPVAEFRFAFPSMFSSDIVSLPGTSTSHVFNALTIGDKKETELGTPGGDKKKTRKEKRGKGKGKPGEDTPSGPGSKSALAVPLSSSELWIAGVVVKTEQAALHYKMTKPEDMCWPVLLTKKKGEAALELCPDHAKHGGLNAACHKRPKNFDLEYIYKHFTRAATSAENKAQDWTTMKKRKA